jgi:hypothetical protein
LSVTYNATKRELAMSQIETTQVTDESRTGRTRKAEATASWRINLNPAEEAAVSDLLKSCPIDSVIAGQRCDHVVAETWNDNAGVKIVWNDVDGFGLVVSVNGVKARLPDAPGLADWIQGEISRAYATAFKSIDEPEPAE